MILDCIISMRGRRDIHKSLYFYCMCTYCSGIHILAELALEQVRWFMKTLKYVPTINCNKTSSICANSWLRLLVLIPYFHPFPLKFGCAKICTRTVCPCHKMARGHLVFALSVLPSFSHSVASKFVFSTPPTILHGFEWNLVQMFYHKSRSACGEIIHVRHILAELWSLTLRIFTHFSLSSQLLLHPYMDLNETWQRCCTTSLEVHAGR